MFVTWFRDSTLLCPCSFTLARVFMDYIKFGKLGNSSVLSLRRLWFTYFSVNSHLDCCFGVPKYQRDRLKMVIVFGIPKLDHISSSLFHLQWLPVAYRVHFKATFYMPLLLQLIAYIPVIKASLKFKELITRPLVIAPLPILGHFLGTNC